MRTRFAPSPSGSLHIGGARTALFAWLWARKNNGQFILRIEDTDAERSSENSVQSIIKSIDWLGLDYDEGPYFQSRRRARYQEIAETLIRAGKAYYCECSAGRLEAVRKALTARGEKPKYDGHCRDKNLSRGALRFRGETGGEIIFDDWVKGKISVKNRELDDFVIVRSDSAPTYHLSVVADDHDMKIDDVIRGDDHLSNTPKHIHLYRALGWKPPRFAHLPMILGKDGARLSKRHGSDSILKYRDQGYLPEALRNYLLRLGFSHGDKEIFTDGEMLDLFDLKKINRAAAIFNPQKLLWLNQHYIQSLPDERIKNDLSLQFENLNLDLRAGPELTKIIAHLKKRGKTLAEIAEQAKMFYRDFEHFDENLAKKFFTPEGVRILKILHQDLSALENWNEAGIHSIIEKICTDENQNFGAVGQPFRLALSGDGKSPGIALTAELLGREKTLKRLTRAINNATEKKRTE